MTIRIITLLLCSIYCAEAQIQPYSLVISEIMADPTPSVGLPEAEYIEIYNRSADVIDLSTVSFRNGSKILDLPNLQILPLEYMIICDIDDRAALEIYGDLITFESFPALANTTEDLALIDRATDMLIHEVVYNRSWYNNSDKDDGGWSLEMINPSDACGRASNWSSSEGLIGGSPAAENSIINNDSVTAFEVLTLLPSENQIIVVFSKSLDHRLTKEVVHLSGSALPIEIESIRIQSDQLEAFLNDRLQVGTEYELSLGNIEDCRSQKLLESTFHFVLPAQAMPGDLIINEILFNPMSGGSDYIELFNPSQKSILLSSLFLANLVDGNLVKQVKVERIHDPNTYLVLTEDRNFLLANYSNVESKQVIEMDLPSMADDHGNVTLYRVEGPDRLVIDALDYSRNFHLSLLHDENGVSLERISTTAATNNPSNWQSAAEVAGFGTPTAPNSQRLSLESASEMFAVSPRVFSPDGDGIDDFAIIQYNLIQTGIRINVRIFDAAGRLIRDLANQVSLSTQGILKWDGTDDSGSKLPMGIYTILAEGFNENGDLLKWSESCVLANRL